MSQIRLRQLKIDPDLVLGRRGCFLEEGKRPLTFEFFEGTPFEKYLTDVKGDFTGLFNALGILKNDFPNMLSICRKSHLKKFEELKKEDQDLINSLIDYKILNSDLSLVPMIESFGTLFECAVGHALHEAQIQSFRDGKIKYPFQNKQYDPDGQLYDILGAIDITKLLWIECKKPLYLDQNNPLGKVISKDNIEKFIRRAFFLKPDIAIYLVDTKEDYKNSLRALFKPEFLTSGNYIEYFEESDNIIARLNDFIYFARVNYRSNSLFFDGLKDSINQVLYDATKIKGSEAIFNILK